MGELDAYFKGLPRYERFEEGVGEDTAVFTGTRLYQIGTASRQSFNQVSAIVDVALRLYAFWQANGDGAVLDAPWMVRGNRLPENLVAAALIQRADDDAAFDRVAEGVGVLP